MIEIQGKSPQTTLASLKLPWQVQAFYFLQNLFTRDRPPLTEEEVLQSAKEETGLDDWGDESFRDALRAFIEAFARDAHENARGKKQFRQLCIDRVALRMRLVDWWNRHPEILDTPIERPLFITGLPRSGTTLLHNLIAQDSENRPLLWWEQFMPVPPPEPETHATDPRIDQAARLGNKMRKVFPQLNLVHPFMPDGPEECNGLFSPEFTNLLTLLYVEAYSFIDWIKERDMIGSYQFYKKELQLLSWKFPDRRWVLKMPGHLAFLDSLLAVFPDASIIQNHRDPTQALPSVLNLAYILRMLNNGWADLGRLAAQSVEVAVLGTERAIKVRAAADPGRFFDVSYRQLVADPIAMVRRIYEQFGYHYSEEHETRMIRWLEDNPQHKYGVHRYTLEEFGLDREDIYRRMALYLETYRDFI